MTPQTPGTPEYETDEPVLYETQDAVAILTLNRPQYHNAQNAQLLYALDGAWARAIADPAIRCLLLRANGRHFSAGHDIGSPGRDVDKVISKPATLHPDHTLQGGAARQYFREQEAYLGLCKRWRSASKPAVAEVQGGCIAGGLMLAWVCDIIVASDDAFFSDPVLRMGVPGVEYFAHAFEMQPRIAREFLFLGEKMPAQRAYELGMVNRLVTRDQLNETGMAIARRISELPEFGVALAKKAFNFQEERLGKGDTLESAFGMHHLAHAHNQIMSGDSIAGMRAKDMKKE